MSKPSSCPVAGLRMLNTGVSIVVPTRSVPLLSTRSSRSGGTTCAGAGRLASTRLTAMRRERRIMACLRDEDDAALGLPVPDHHHLHDLVVDVGMRHRRAFDEQAVALEADEAGPLAADPGLVPGGFDLRDHLAALDPVAAGVGDHRGERAGAF